MSHHGPGHHIWLQLPNQGVLQKHQRHAPLPTIAGITRTQDQDGKGTTNWQIHHIYMCVYIYIHIYIYCIYTLYVCIYCIGGSILGFTNFEPAICLAGWSRIASIKPLNKPRPVLHSLRKNSEKNTCLCTTTFFTPMLPLHSAVLYIAMETEQTFALLFQISQRRYDEVRFFGSQNPSNLEPRHLAVLQIGIECNYLSLDAVLIIFLIHTGYL